MGKRLEPAGHAAQIQQNSWTHVFFQRHLVHRGRPWYEMVGSVNVGADVGGEA